MSDKKKTVAPEGYVRWTLLIPIKGEAEVEVFLPPGSTKYDALRAHVDGQSKLIHESWGYLLDRYEGEVATACGPGCDGEEVDPWEEDEEDDEDEEE